MKAFFGEYVKIISRSIMGLIFGLGFFYILLNAFHASSIDKSVYVSESDVYYSNYMNNVMQIKKNLDSYRYDSNKFAFGMPTLQKISSEISSCYNILNSKEAILGYSEGMEIGYKEVYNLNNYFINDLSDEYFVSNLSWVLRDDELKNSTFGKRVANYNAINDILAYNGSYLKDELRDNSSYYYNTSISNAMIRDNLNSSYRMVARNYYDFSQIVLDLSEYLVGGDYND